MASWLSFTNHKLYQCRLLLQQADTTTQPQALHEALQDSALYALRDAYLSYLHELAELATYRQPVSGLAQLLADTPLITGEMKELEYLETDSFSWLKAMLKSLARNLTRRKISFLPSRPQSSSSAVATRT